MENKNLKKFFEEHINYEVVMLHNSKCYIEKFQTLRDKIGEYVSLESFLLHGRNIIEFVFFNATKEYSRATDFFEDEEWRKIKPTMSANIKNFLNRANTELAHLTYKRQYGKTKKKKWHYNEIFLEILNCLKIFLDNLPSKYKGAKIEGVNRIFQLYST